MCTRWFVFLQLCPASNCRLEKCENGKSCASRGFDGDWRGELGQGYAFLLVYLFNLTIYNFSFIFMLVLYLTDLDECAKNDTCAANEVCVNTVGNYTCSCAPGYRGEAGSCQGNCLSFFCCCCGCFLFCVCVCVCV